MLLILKQDILILKLKRLTFEIPYVSKMLREHNSELVRNRLNYKPVCINIFVNVYNVTREPLTVISMTNVLFMTCRNACVLMYSDIMCK